MESRDGIDQNLVPDPANGSNSMPPQPPPPPLSGVQEAANNNENERTIPVIRYRDCRKNHAASIGGHAVDGCGEFMAGGEEGTRAFLTCAACHCHRNFHRREESDGHSNSNSNSNGGGGYAANLYRSPPPPPPPPPRHPVPTVRPSPNHHYIYGSTTAVAASPSTPTAPVMMMMNFSRDGGVTAESSSEGFNLFQSNIFTGETSSNSNKKRFRTIFTNLQKEKMHDFAEKLGWKIQRQDEPQVQQFCNEVGIKRRVLKVWMHNYKQAMKKKD